MQSIRFSLVVLTALFLVSCAGDGSARDAVRADPPDGATIIVLGDSMMDWNAAAGASIPDVIAESLGREVYSGAVGGATMRGGDDGIPAQYQPGSWDWVVFDGGGNDLNDACACGECDEVMNEILTADAQSGLARDLADRAVQDGAQVMLVGYLALRDDAAFGFDRCADWLDEQTTRWQMLANSHPDIFFVSAADVVRADDDEAYDDDNVHPSVEGSRLIGEHIAAAILGAEAN